MIKRAIVSGGGTAGHIYPALAVADELKSRGVEVLFVGALGKMEMERVPLAGYKIVGLPIVGLQRRLTLSNLVVPFKLLRSMGIARRVIKDFMPDVVVGFGGYASAPIVKAAQRAGVRTIIQEQNSFAGLTNRMLARQASAICTAYDGMERFFDKDKIVVTGNPLRGNIGVLPSRASAIASFGLDPRRSTILVTGGSLGTRTLNEMMLAALQGEHRSDVQIIWQTGKFYYDEMDRRAAGLQGVPYVKMPFIERMDMAYAAADVVICRAGASTVSELELLGVPTVFVPSPNVSEDHQTANARSLVERGAALMVHDSDAVANGVKTAIELLRDGEKMASMSANLKLLGKPYAAVDVADIACGDYAKRVYFIGIGGIGMSAIARFFAHQGYVVAGYDRVSTPLTLALENEGISIHYEDNVALIPAQFLKKSTAVIYTPAVANHHSELTYFTTNGYDVKKRSQALGLLCRGRYLMAVAGTHGKSTTSTMVAWFNSIAGDGGSAFLGAISKNFGSNMVLGAGDSMTVEADEFDRSFHQLFPDVALVTAADADHLDIYGDADSFHKAFEKFVGQVKHCAIVKVGLDLPCKFRYSLDDASTDYYAKNIELLDGGYYRFDIVTPSRTIAGCTLGVAGIINVENAIGAVAVVDQRGVDDAKLRDALASFKGIERRFDFWINEPRKVYMDDYAHHPLELTAMLTSMRSMFAGRHITIVFQPHLYSRTRDFASEFSAALSLADRVILLPIYPAREEPIDGVTSAIIYDNVTVEKMVVEKGDLASTLTNLQTDVVITAGAGDIDVLRSSVNEIIGAK